MTDVVPFFVPNLDGKERANLLEVVNSGWLTTGGVVARFETEFADAVGAKHAVAVNSCTAALQLALKAWGVGPGDEVIVPTMSFASAAEVVMHLGATPVLVDCDPADLCLDARLVTEAVTRRTRAVMPMHYGGQPCEMDGILAVAEARGLAVVDDAAHAFPASYRGAPIGSIGDATCFSFYANKTLTTGEGGMVTTNDESRAERIRTLSLHGLSRSAWSRFDIKKSWDYDIVELGYKVNLTDLAGALGLAQLERAEHLRGLRAEAVTFYNHLLAPIPWMTPLRRRSDVVSADHLYVVLLPEDTAADERDRILWELRAQGITGSVHYKPLHMQPLLEERYAYRPEDLPVSAGLFSRMISLPLFPDITQAQIARVVDAVKAIGGPARS